LSFNGTNRPLLLPSISRGIGVCAALCLTLTLAPAADKPTFQVKPADQYASRQTSEGVTIGAEAFITDDQAKTAFGKLNPWQYNVLPVLVVIRNSTKNTIRLENMHIEYELPDRSRVFATPAADVKYSRGPSRPKVATGPIGGIKIGGGKNPLSAPEIESRAFAAKILPPGESASGFVYFETDVTSAGASLYVTGLADASTGKELYYFEIPLQGQ
jgi:hypothetical protein